MHGGTTVVGGVRVIFSDCLFISDAVLSMS